MAKILLVDDENDLVDMITMRLEAHGYDVVSANDGLSGLELARNAKPDLVILDVMMPGLDGYEVCQRIKNDGALRHIPVIIASARTQKQDIEKGTAAGADMYVSKPCEPADLLAAIANLLRK